MPDQFLDQDVDDIGQFSFGAGGVGRHGVQPAVSLRTGGTDVDELTQDFLMT